MQVGKWSVMITFHPLIQINITEQETLQLAKLP